MYIGDRPVFYDIKISLVCRGSGKKVICMATMKKNSKSVPSKRGKSNKKQCSSCQKPKHLREFYKSNSPLHSLDNKVPICKDCVAKLGVNENNEVDVEKFKVVCRQLDKPFYIDCLQIAADQVKKYHPDIPQKDIKYYGDKIIGFYFTRIGSMVQYKDKVFADSEKTNYITPNSNVVPEGANIDTLKDITSQHKKMFYSKEWRGEYTIDDIEYLDNYYAGLQRDYNIITENHKDYARKIAKASMQMDKAFDDVIKNVPGADARYKAAREAFDSLCKSAKFSESTRSVNDVGASSFSKIASMVESHNWIPEHKPVEKDEVDKIIEYLSTITKSV